MGGIFWLRKEEESAPRSILHPVIMASMPHALVTGGAGFFGGILKRSLLARDWTVASVDLQTDEDRHGRLTAIQGDIRDAATLDKIFAGQKVDAVFHCAAILAHESSDKDFLWSCNVEGTRTLAEAMIRHGVRPVVFTSSNCLWGRGMGKPVTEDEPPSPAEIYGRSKWEGEKILASFAGEGPGRLRPVILRCPTIVEAGRMGLLSILFEFIAEGRKVWVVGGGRNRYQFIDAGDLAEACIKSAAYAADATKPSPAVFNVGSDDVKTFREVYQSVIARAGTGARVASLPRRTTLLAMRVAYWLGLSPLGPYQYKMIAEDFLFDTSKIKRELGWHPTVTNEEMLWKAYEFYRRNKDVIGRTTALSAHRQPAKMGVIKVLKWLS